MILMLVMGALLSIPIHRWIRPLIFEIHGYDDQLAMIKFIALVEWPLFLLIGGILGNFIFKRWFLKNKAGQNKIIVQLSYGVFLQF